MDGRNKEKERVVETLTAVQSRKEHVNGCESGPFQKRTIRLLWGEGSKGDPGIKWKGGKMANRREVVSGGRPKKGEGIRWRV